MILVNERQGYRICLECHERLDDSDEYRWMARHADCNAHRQVPPDPRPG